MVFATLLTTVLLALAVAADPIIVKRSLVKLPISRRINVTSVNILQHDQLRAKALRAKGEARIAGTLHSDRAVISSQAVNIAVTYIASVGVGSPATQCKRLAVSNPLA
jgi:cathepsin E